MVISSKTQTELYIPAVVGDAKKLVFKNPITNKEKLVSETAVTNGNYYVFTVNLSNIDEGEYIYTAGSDTGIIRIGKYKETAVSYTSDNKNIEYNAFK